MKITVLRDDGTEVIFQDVIDAFVSVRQIIPISKFDGALMQTVQNKSESWGANPRETVKEVRQAVYEMQKILDDRNS